ncbi:hypothetical protein C7M84_022239 [Penaeus vannamei]|uniref:Uncharacterized protein n=1 Tax=Penaeus vannamei TaxID=6689 RepID=A0A423U7D0_PENVA|nr:hypothetical protein C7M84_022239 [Penaeus vannamei]
MMSKKFLIVALCLGVAVAEEINRAQAAQITQGVIGASAAAYQEAALAGEANVAEQAAKVAASMAQGLLGNLGLVSAETNGLAGQAAHSLGAQQNVLQTQSAMVWQGASEATAGRWASATPEDTTEERRSGVLARPEDATGCSAAEPAGRPSAQAGSGRHHAACTTRGKSHRPQKGWASHRATVKGDKRPVGAAYIRARRGLVDPQVSSPSTKPLHRLKMMFKTLLCAALVAGVLCEDAMNRAAAQATAAAAGLGGAAHAAAAGAASNAAAAAFAASQTAQAAAASKQAQAAAVTQAAQGAQAAAFAEGSLASKANIAYQAAKLTASMAQGLAANVATILSEAKALASQAATSHAEQQAFLNGQRTMAWQAQQAANSLNQQQYTALSDLEDAAGAAAQARAAATKALSKAKGASGYGH